jgi:uncharacterized membrane protein
MQQLKAWLVTLIGLLFLLPLIVPSLQHEVINWIIGLAVLIIGVLMLIKVYKKDQKFGKK